MDIIHTQLHKVMDDVRRGEAFISIPVNKLPLSDTFDPSKFSRKNLLIAGALERMTQVPLFCISEELVDLAVGDPMGASANALVRAGKTRLPYPEMVVEMDVGRVAIVETGIERMRVFVYMKQTSPEELMDVVVCRRVGNGPGAHTILPVGVYQARPKEFVLPTDDGPDKFGIEMGMSIPFINEPISLLERPNYDRIYEVSGSEDGTAAALAMIVALLLMHTRGVEREAITPAKLNKARRKSGKSEVPTHTVLRIGTVTRRDGTTYTYKHDPNTKVMPVHWRRGHYRMQKYGPGWSMEREIYIEPMIVNYVEGETPKPVRKSVVMDNV